MAAEQAFKVVINDTNPASGGRGFGIEVTGSNYNHFLGKRIGDAVDGMFVGEGDKSLPDTSCKSPVAPISRDVP
ncbi:MAG: hypothetical protein Ct9H300mP10_00910 [Methanobacteriota archaeon]|nr:MAG: hypothetical protein Ct9H300mP10_00910 [Euryarchaeota archaeon]